MNLKIAPKTIAGISIIIAIVGIATQFFSFFFYSSSLFRIEAVEVVSYATLLSPVRLSIFGVNLFNASEIMSLAYYVVLLIGAIQFQNSSSSSRLLIFCYLLLFVQNTINIPLTLLSFWNIYMIPVLFILCKTVITIGYAILGFVLLKNLVREKKYETLKYGEGDTAFYTPKEVSRGIRFAHNIIDTILLFALLGDLYARIIILMSPSAYDEWGTGEPTRGSTIVATVVVQTLFFLLSEAIFRVSPAKVLTKTFVVDRDGNTPPSGHLVGRCFARLIPFDALSFLSGNGWHDSASGTTVVKEVREEQTPFIPPADFTQYSNQQWNG